MPSLKSPAECVSLNTLMTHQYRLLVSEYFPPLDFPLTEEKLDIRPSLWADRPLLLKEIATADALLVRQSTRVDEELMAQAPLLKVVGRLGVGLDNLDLAAARRRNIRIVYAPSANARAVAELCLAQTFNLIRRLPKAMGAAAAGDWNRVQFMGREMSECTIGIIGFGQIGREYAAMAAHFGARVLVHMRRSQPVPPPLTRAELNPLLAESDLVSLHIPGGPETDKFFSADVISRMKPGAFLLNTSRGSVIDEEALLTALNSGHLAGAALDVRTVEPPVAAELEKHPNILLTPHIGAFTTAAQQRVCTTVLADVLAVLHGNTPQYPVPNTLYPVTG